MDRFGFLFLASPMHDATALARLRGPLEVALGSIGGHEVAPDADGSRRQVGSRSSWWR